MRLANPNTGQKEWTWRNRTAGGVGEVRGGGGVSTWSRGVGRLRTLREASMKCGAMSVASTAHG